MALWHILVRNIRGLWVPDGDAWDDGEALRPGDEGFGTRAISDVANGKAFNYIGTPDWIEAKA